MTEPESLNPQSAASLRERAEAGDPEAIAMLALLSEPLRPGCSTLPLRNPVDISAILHRFNTRPAASLSTDPLRDGPATSTHQETRTDDDE